MQYVVISAHQNNIVNPTYAVMQSRRMLMNCLRPKRQAQQSETHKRGLKYTCVMKDTNIATDKIT